MSTVLQNGDILLAIDTCGPTGSVALGRVSDHVVEILGQTELEGRNYSATLITAVREQLACHQLTLGQLRGIVVVNGPGSFTGIRIGLSAVKGLTTAVSIPVVSLSRLAVLAHKAHIAVAALDAHRDEVFFKSGSSELLAGRQELLTIAPMPEQIAVCDEAAARLLLSVWPSAQIVRIAPPAAADAMQFVAASGVASELVSPLLLDAHYLRRSDAEIFGQ